MIARISMCLACLSAVAPAAAAKALPEVVQATAAATRASAACAPAAPSGRSDVVTCAFSAPPIDRAAQSFVLHVTLPSPVRTCATAQVIQLGPVERATIAVVAEAGPRRSKTAC